MDSKPMELTIMPRTGHLASIILLSAFGLTHGAFAQEAPPPQPPPPAAPAAPTTPPPPSVQPPPPAQPSPPQYVYPKPDEYTATGGREFKGSPEDFYGEYPSSSSYSNPKRQRNEAEFMFGVPIWFTSKDGVVDPGISFEGRFARRFHFIAPEFTVGWQVNWLDEDKLSGAAKNANITIDSLFFSLGARLYVAPDAEKVMPFISAAADFNFVHITGNEDLVCGYYYCTAVADYEFAFGLSSRLGLAIKATPVMQIELGAKIAMLFPGGVVDETEAWVSPFIGFATVM